MPEGSLIALSPFTSGTPLLRRFSSMTHGVLTPPGQNLRTVLRATVYFHPYIHRALRLKAAAADRSISDMVNEAVKAALAEDEEDLAAFDERKHERSLSFETFVKNLKRRGRL